MHPDGSTSRSGVADMGRRVTVRQGRWAPLARMRRRRSTGSVTVALLGIMAVALTGPAVAQPVDFPDIGGTTHEAGIDAIVEAGITEGYPDGTFGPWDSVTRGQMATFITRGFGLDIPDGAAPFDDVAGTTHQDAIRAVEHAGVADGFGDGSFRPGEYITRGQTATFLARAAGLEAVPPSYLDTTATTHAGAIGAVAEAGIAAGREDGTFGPGDRVRRGQMATFLARALDLMDRADPPPPPSVSACVGAGETPESAAECLFAAMDAAQPEDAAAVATPTVLQDVEWVREWGGDLGWEFDGCGAPIILQPSSGRSCIYFEDVPDLPHGVVIEFGMGEQAGHHYVEDLGSIG